MKNSTSKQIKKRIEKIDERLANAEQYLARNVNVESSSFCHFSDWEGKSGHPLWMRNFMIPATMKARGKNAKALTTIAQRAKDKRVTERRRREKHEAQLRHG